MILTNLMTSLKEKCKLCGLAPYQEEEKYMFWFRKAVVETRPFEERQEDGGVAVAQAPALPQPQKIEAPGEADEVREYVALCQKIGAETPAVRMLQLEQFMADHGIPEYDDVQVHDHLCKLAKQAGGEYAMYNWHPVREKDNGVDFRWYFINRENRQRTCEISPLIYHDLIPASVLETMATIIEHFPDANFFVSDIPDDPDPFLLVTFPGVSPLIVDFWNEPGFTQQDT